MTTLGQRLKMLRIEKRLKQKDIQAHTKISQRYLSALENDRGDPTFSVLWRIAGALGVTVDVMVCGITEEPKHG